MDSITCWISRVSVLTQALTMTNWGIPRWDIVQTKLYKHLKENTDIPLNIPLGFRADDDMDVDVEFYA